MKSFSYPPLRPFTPMLHGRRSKSSMLLSTISPNFNICLGIKDLINAYPLGECCILFSYADTILSLRHRPFGGALQQHLAISLATSGDLDVGTGQPQHLATSTPGIDTSTRLRGDIGKESVKTRDRRIHRPCGLHPTPPLSFWMLVPAASGVCF